MKSTNYPMNPVVNPAFIALRIPIINHHHVCMIRSTCTLNPQSSHPVRRFSEFGARLRFLRRQLTLALGGGRFDAAGALQMS